MKFKKFTGIIIIALCVSLVSASQAWCDVEINESNFPDKNFRDYVSENFDTNFNRKLDDAEINQVYYIEVPSNGITSLRGIEFFTALTWLNCASNQLTELDVSNNTALTWLDCVNNQLTELDVSNNTALTWLECGNNQLTELDVSNNTALTRLDCYNNQLMALDLSNNTDLTYAHYDQYIDPFLVSQDTDGNYIIDLNKYMSSEQIKNVSINEQTQSPLSYDQGIIKFASSVNNISYTYDTGNDDIGDMTVNLSNFITSFSKPEIISDSSLPSAICYEMYDELIQANGTRPINFSIIDGKLPEGLEFERVTAYYSNGDIYDCGNISGIPTETGTFKFTVKASNSLGEDSKDFTLIVSEDQHNPPSINPTYLSECTINQWYAVQVSISGKRPITFSISEGNLPNGVTIDSETGLISGTPTESGIFRFTMKAVNVVSEDTQELTLIVNEQNPTISITTSRYLSYATQNQEYSQTLNAIGETPITWALDEDSSLPSGLTLSPEGVISGTPTETGTFKFVAIASNSSSKVMREFILYVMTASTPISQDIIIITPSKLPDATINQEYNLQLEASGDSPIVWQLMIF